MGATQWLQMGTNRSSRSIAGPIKATRVSGSRTFPAGSSWTRNPIPACKGPGFGNLTVDARAPEFGGRKLMLRVRDWPSQNGVFGFG